MSSFSRAFVALALVAIGAGASLGCKDPPPQKGGPVDSGLVDAEVVRFFGASNGKQVTVVRGAFVIELTSPRTQGHRFEWSDPVISAGVVEPRGHEILEPGKDVDGGSFRHVFRFDAVSTGSTKITLTPKNGPDLPPPFVLDVTVK